MLVKIVKVLTMMLMVMVLRRMEGRGVFHILRTIMQFSRSKKNLFRKHFQSILCRELPYTVDEAETLPLASVIPSRWRKRGRAVGDVKI